MAPQDQEKASLLSPTAYDDDAPDVGSDRDPLSDDEDSAERAQEEQGVFEDDYEEEEMGAVGMKRLFNRSKSDGEHTLTIKERRAEKRASRRHRERVKRGEEEAELVYDMEEGGRPSQSPSRNSSESDLRRLAATRSEKSLKMKTGKRPYTRFLIHASIILFFLLLLFAAYKATKASRSRQAKVAAALSLSNGTSLFAPTTILISLDGFRADFLQRGLTPTLSKFIREGVSPLYMYPSFPSVTFPNHYTMVTGLYPESHGIVGNTFWDPEMKDDFYYTHPQKSMQPKWWGGEPLWVTAEKQGMRSAIHMWPGSEAHIAGIEPAHMDKYNGDEDLTLKVDRIMELIDLPGPDIPSARANNPRPQLIAAYVPNVDADGHQYGPNSTEIRQTIRNVDDMLSGVFRGLQERNLTEIVNVVVVSDHGMATTSVERLIQLEDIIDVNLIDRMDGWPLYGLRPKNIDDLWDMYVTLKKNTEHNTNLEVYLTAKDMPKQYHFSKNDRIAPLWIVPKAGWAVVTKKEFDVEKGKKEGLIYHPRGLHGYDHHNSLMRAIFVARGPAFPHTPGSRVEVFQNTEVYNIVCDSLGLEPKANNGTLRLPLKPVGLHTDDGAPEIDTPFDPPTDGPEAGSEVANSIMSSHSSVSAQATSPASAFSLASSEHSLSSAFSSASSAVAASTTDATFAITTAPSTPPSESSKAPDATPEEEEKHSPKKWWSWIASTFEDAKAKLSQLFGPGSS
ncbi:Phosphodiest-domain-containing protein [Venturia nashicola]|uniref:Phosphodiest-domain-containing protein n=1 Tax=Venturia nashicola TaxID=86259 RepID=A0A4Z1P5I5_9PEZI|nr:Phosphodiest-domain-containing protein [Venturia nashicola]